MRTAHDTPPEPSNSLVPLTIIRTETALSRYPIHRISKRGNITIEIRRKKVEGAAALLWEVSHNSKYGQPGPLAYKLDTIVINRKIEEAGKPIPRLLRIGTLKEIAEELDLGRDTNSVKRALLQNAFAAITARITYRGKDRTERYLDAAFTRYSVIFTGEALPDGRKADSVYLVLNDIYMEVLSNALSRPLDYDYLKALAPGAQRFYEIVSYQIYAALHNKNPRARLVYSDYCLLSTQTRYLDWEHVKKQMYKVHLPHLKSGYLTKVEFEACVDGEGQPDWNMYYVPGPNAAAEYRAFKGGGNQAVQRLPKRSQGEVLALPFARELPDPPEEASRAPAPDPAMEALVEELVASDLNRDCAVLYAREYPEECRRQLDFIRPMRDEDFTEGRGAYLNKAIPGHYGPTRAYWQANRAEEARQRKEAKTLLKSARQSHQEGRREAILSDLRNWAVRMENEHPEAFSNFAAKVERELQTQLARFKAEKAQESYRRLYASEKKRLEIFVRYFAENPCPLEDFTAWLSQHPSQEIAAAFSESR